MISLLLMLTAGAQDAPDLMMDDDLMGFLNAQKETWPDRSKRPQVTVAEPWELPEWQEHALSDGVRVLHVQVEGVRKVELQLTRHRGALDLDGKTSPSTFATGWLMDSATALLSAQQLEIKADLLDMGLWSNGLAFTRAELGFDVPVEDFDASLDLFVSVLKTPAYPKADIQRWTRDELLDLEVYYRTSGGAVASRAMHHSWFAADTPYGQRDDLSAYKGIDTTQLVKRNLQLNAESPMTVMVVGDMSWQDLEPKLKAAFTDLGAKGEESPMPEFSSPAASRFIAVDMPGAEQAVVRMRMAAPKLGHDDQDVMDAVNWAYGGAFLSRLNRSIREEKGWTYGSRSSYGAADTYGTFSVSYDTGVDTTADAIAETVRVLEELAEGGCTADEIEASYLESVGVWNNTNVDAASAHGFYDWLLNDGLTVATARERLLATGSLTPEQTAKAASTWLGSDQPRVWVVVGDRSKLEPELAELGWEWEWLDVEAAVMGTF